MKTKFNGKVLVLGCGSVSQCTLPLLLKHLEMPPSKITVMDMVDNREKVKNILERGVKYVIDKIERHNIGEKLMQHLGPGDLLIDLAWNIGCIDILQWCHDNKVLYINSSVELWDPYEGAEDKPPTERTLYARHMAIRDWVKNWKEKGTTAVVEHGANPGLVSHFTKIALEDIANKIISEKPKDARVPELKQYLKEGKFNKISQLAGVKVIHISERDTQIANKPKRVNEFVNTWSIEGFREEGIAPAELGWGTHEKRLPNGANFHKYGPGNQICLSQMGIKTWVRSWVPAGEITGMIIRHGEAFTISDHLTVWEDGKPVYRPTVHYAYCPCDEAMNSLHELEMRNFNLQEDQRILEDEIIEGQDQLGVLLMGHDFTAWWTGSLLDIHEARRLVPHQQATTLQVACSVVAAALWMIKNPNEGFKVPDNLPYKEIMEVAKLYLGPFISQPVDWTPLKNRVNLFGKYGDPPPPEEEVWQFTTFLVSP